MRRKPSGWWKPPAALGRFAGGYRRSRFCRGTVNEAAAFLGGRIDILVNNAAEQHVKDFADIPEDRVERTFRPISSACSG